MLTCVEIQTGQQTRPPLRNKGTSFAKTRFITTDDDRPFPIAPTATFESNGKTTRVDDAPVVHFIDEFLINGLLVGGLARSTSGRGNFFRRLQSGNLQGYAILFGAGVLLVIYLTVFAR